MEHTHIMRELIGGMEHRKIQTLIKYALLSEVVLL